MASIRPLKVISGGQAGVDQVALRIARSHKQELADTHPGQIETGGWMPKGWWTTEGARPDFAKLYGMRECPVEGYPARTMMNAREGHITVWFGEDSKGMACTRNACHKLHRDFVSGDTIRTPESVLRLLRLAAHCIDGDEGPLILNVAGTRKEDSDGAREAKVFMQQFLEWYRLWL